MSRIAPSNKPAPPARTSGIGLAVAGIFVGLLEVVVVPSELCVVLEDAGGSVLELCVCVEFSAGVVGVTALFVAVAPVVFEVLGAGF